MRSVVILAHILPSMVPVVERVMKTGVGITFIGKPYSTIASAAEAMRDVGATVHTPGFGQLGKLVEEMQDFVRALVLPEDALLFDSGGVLKSIYGRGHQLTTHAAKYPWEIGLNPEKRHTEAPYIAQAILTQIPHAGRRVMVIGDGVIGKA